MSAADGRVDAVGRQAPMSMGDLGRAIGRYTESEGGDSAETLAAHRGLFDIYDRWVDQGRPEHDSTIVVLDPSTSAEAFGQVLMRARALMGKDDEAPAASSTEEGDRG